MTRREVLALLGAAAAVLPSYARGQGVMKMARVGFLGLSPASASANRVEALRMGLRELGYIEGKNIVIEFRWAEGITRMHELAADLVHENVDLIFATEWLLSDAGLYGRLL
jgi:putative ABC transport system substrate-binding protein